MLRGFPSNFPCSFNATCENIEEEAAMFVRSEIIEENLLEPIPKKPKAERNFENNVIDELVIEDSSFKHVKFCGEPPMEFFTFTEKEYDRSPMNSINKSKYKRYLIRDTEM